MNQIMISVTVLYLIVAPLVLRFFAQVVPDQTLPVASTLAAPITAATIKIAIVDTGWRIPGANTRDPELKLCPTGHYDYYTNTPMVNVVLPHGVRIGSIIAQALSDVDYCAVIFQVWTEHGITSDSLAAALRRAKQEGVKFINVSITGTEPSPKEKRALRELGDAGITVFVAAGNEGRDLSKSCQSYPTCYGLPNIVSVGATLNGSKDKTNYSNYGKYVSAWYPGELIWHGQKDIGTSYAAPRALSDRVRSYWRSIHPTTH